MAEEFVNPKNDSGGAVISKSQAQTAMKNLQAEATSLSPTALIELFEIDLSNILSPDKLIDREEFNALNVFLGGSLEVDIHNPEINLFRFHNNLKLISRNIWFQDNLYKAIPIQAEGFELNSNGVAATPKLSLSVSLERNPPQFAIFKHLLKDLNDMVGARVNRIRTFAKFLDYKNWYELKADGTPDFNKRLYEDIPKNIAPDEGSYFPPDVYYIDRKSHEDKTSLQFELASFINFEELKIPQRIFNMTRCPWLYRGQGCTYEYASMIRGQGTSKPFEMFNKTVVPTNAPPVATENNESISSIIDGYAPETTNTPIPWQSSLKYPKKSTVYVTHNKINYYFVASADVPENKPPPDKTYWVADVCAKDLGACKLRWDKTLNKGLKGSPYDSALPFGGFPAIKRQ